ncbi:MAG: ATP-binding protein [Anaerolineaceae bacterium]
MSIRLRFTLIFNAILAVTLAIFGFSLYSILAHNTMNSLKEDLVYSSNSLAATLVQVALTYPPGIGPVLAEQSPRAFENLSDSPYIKRLPEREIVRVLDASGNLIASPFGLSDDALPLSEEGLADLNQGAASWETTTKGEHLLIYSSPIFMNGELQMILQIARPLTERDRSLESLRNTLTIASLVTLAIAFGVGWILSGYTLRPIQRITQTAQEIGNERDFTRRVDYQGPQDEVGQLATTFNGMLVNLEEAYRKVANSLQMQRNFVADVSHELRTPLTTLRGNLGLLRHEPPIPQDEQADILNDMVDETDRMIRLVNELLVQARADAGQSLAHEPVNLTPLMEEAIRQAHQLAEERDIILASPADLTILGDRDALKQVLLILLDNALKHSSSGVKLEAKQTGKVMEICVIDQGEGIPAEQLGHVFDRFYRGEKTYTPGFGLGLSIAKGLVEGMGGTIMMESEMGKGSTVRMQLQAGE